MVTFEFSDQNDLLYQINRNIIPEEVINRIYFIWNCDVHSCYNLGVNVCNVRIGSLFWADDFVLIANNDYELQLMLDQSLVGP